MWSTPGVTEIGGFTRTTFGRASCSRSAMVSALNAVTAACGKSRVGSANEWAHAHHRGPRPGEKTLVARPPSGAALSLSPPRGEGGPDAVLGALVVGGLEPRALEAQLERRRARALETPAEPEAVDRRVNWTPVGALTH